MVEATKHAATLSRRCQLIPRGFHLPLHGYIEECGSDALHIVMDDIAASAVLDYNGAVLIYPGWGKHQRCCIRGASANRLPSGHLSIRSTAAREALHAIHGDINGNPTEKKRDGRLDVTRLVTYRLTRTEREMAEAIDVRTKAYQHAGKHASAGLMTDGYDTCSDFLAIFLGGHVIGGLRLIRHSSDSTWEHEPLVDWSKLPPKDASIEITRVSVLPEYQKQSLLMGLFQRVAIYIVRSGKRHLIGCTTEKQRGMYQAIGCTILEDSFIHPSLGSMPHRMLCKDVTQGLVKCDPWLAWTVIWPDVYRLLAAEKALETGSLTDRVKRRMMTALRPFVLSLATAARAL